MVIEALLMVYVERIADTIVQRRGCRLTKASAEF